MKKSEFENLIHEAQLSIDVKNQPQMENFLKSSMEIVADKNGNVPYDQAVRAAYYAASKFAIGISAAVTGEILVKLGIVTLEAD